MAAKIVGGDSLLLLLLLVVVVVRASLLEMAMASPAANTGKCNGSMAECGLGEEEEFMMDSEIHRRFLQPANRYISYRVLHPNRPFGNSNPGKAYGNTFHSRCNTYDRCRDRP